MSKHRDNVIHKQAGVRRSKMTTWQPHDGGLEMGVPHYYSVNPFRGGRLRATGAKSVGLEAVLKHIGGEG